MNRATTATIPGDIGIPRSIEPTAESVEDSRSETIVLETREFELDDGDPPPATVRQKFTIHNLAAATTTEFAHFHQHYLMIRQKRKGLRPRSALINLRYLDARPALSRREAKNALIVALAAFVGALLAGALAYFSPFLALGILFAVALTGVSGIALWLYARRATETISFCTAEGRVPAFALHANVGCKRACRAVVPRLVAAITEARRENPPDRRLYLRREMREHYRLREIGVLSADGCEAGTRRILGKF